MAALTCRRVVMATSKPSLRTVPPALACLTSPAFKPRAPLQSSRRVLHSSACSNNAQTATKQQSQSAQDKASFKDPLTRYEHLVTTGVIKADPHQKGIIQKLQRLWTDLETYEPGTVPQPSSEVTPSFFGKFFSRSHKTPEPTHDPSKIPKGLYLYGSVGTGKTMLMDLFYSTLPPQFKGPPPHPTSTHPLVIANEGTKSKYGSTRIHFHAFMLDVLQRQHEVQAKYVDLGLGMRDATPEVARQLASEGRVLCFDEFQVTDIVTAMILRQLLERLMGFGVVCIMTSNRHPDELYQNGIQRQSFIPAIELIKDRFEVVDLNSETDYRKMPRALKKVYYHPLTTENKTEMTKLFHSLASSSSSSSSSSTNGANEIVSHRKLHLWGRDLIVPESSETVARFKFSDLCDKPLSAADYLEVTGTFGTVFVEDVPKMGLGEKDQARRFITFIDACYENKTKVFISSEVPIFQVFSDDSSPSSANDHVRNVMDDLGLDENVGSSSLFSGDEELFAFARCVSRLSQMGTIEWSEANG